MWTVCLSFLIPAGTEASAVLCQLQWQWRLHGPVCQKTARSTFRLQLLCQGAFTCLDILEKFLDHELELTPRNIFSLVHKVQLGTRHEAAVCRWWTDQNLLDYSDAPAEGRSWLCLILSRVWQEVCWVSTKRAGQRKLLSDVRATVFCLFVCLFEHSMHSRWGSLSRY